MATATEVLTREKVMHVMDAGGDSQIRWNPDNPDEVAAARSHFNTLLGRQHLAFRMSASGAKGEQIREFDSTAERILMVPRSVGG